jgi:hypothetical protein
MEQADRVGVMHGNVVALVQKNLMQDNAKG